MEKLNVLYQSSSAYVVPAAVSICSLLENNKDIETIEIWYLECGLTLQDKGEIQKLVEKYGRKVSFLSGAEADRFLSETGVQEWSGSYATFYKIFLSSMLSGIDKILYIDADTVVLGSLKELCRFDFAGNAAAMAGSGMTGAVKEYLDLPDYFNAGVVYFNLKYWREHELEAKFLGVINGPGAKRYTMVGDESLLNYVLKGKIKKLPLKYNFESSWWLWGWNKRVYGRLGWGGGNRPYYSSGEIKEAKEKTVIGHYVDLTTGRPWDRLNDNPFRREFEKYYGILAPWKRIKLPLRGIGADNKAVFFLKSCVKKCLPFRVRSGIGFKQHHSFWVNKIKEIR